MWSLIPFLSDLWKCETRPLGAELGQGCFQFQFASEKDIVKVLDNQPYHFAHWMVIMQRWEPSMSPSFPSQIPFWIHVQGIPLHLWSAKALECIADDIRTFDKVEITSTIVKMRVFVSGLEPLITKTTLEFDEGPEVEATLVYEKLQNHCSTCLRLSHVKDDCPDKPSSPGRSPTRQPQLTAFQTRHLRTGEPRREDSRHESEKRFRTPRSPQNQTRTFGRNHHPQGSERYGSSNYYSSESLRLKNPPSTERTVTARPLPKDLRDYISPRRRETNNNSYNFCEYRRSIEPYPTRGSDRMRYSKPTWVEKRKQRDERHPLSVFQLETSASSLPKTNPPYRGTNENLPMPPPPTSSSGCSNGRA